MFCQGSRGARLILLFVDSYVASAPFTQWNDGVGPMDETLNAGGAFPGPMGGGGMAQPRFFPGAWGSCSTSCGPGVRARTVDCVAFQGITGSVIKLPEYECEGLQFKFMHKHSMLIHNVTCRSAEATAL